MKKRVAWIMLMAGLVALAMSVAIPAPSEAVTWYVKTTGDNALNSCLSLAKPCKTIQGVINKGTIVDGDSITVSAGLYVEDMSFELTKNNVTITGFGATIDCAGGGPGTNPAPGGCVLRGNNNTFKGFTVIRGWVKTGDVVDQIAGCGASPPTGNSVRQVTFKASLFTANDTTYTGGTGLEIRDCNSNALSNLNSFTADPLDNTKYAFLLINNNYNSAAFSTPGPTPSPELVPPTLSTNTFDAAGNYARAALVLCSEADFNGAFFTANGNVTVSVSPVTLLGANAFRNKALVIGTFWGSYFCPPY